MLNSVKLKPIKRTETNLSKLKFIAKGETEIHRTCLPEKFSVCSVFF